MFAAIAQGHNDLAEVLYLVAFILAVVATIIRAAAHAYDGACTAAAIGCVALAFLIL